MGLQLDLRRLGPPLRPPPALLLGGSSLRRSQSAHGLIAAAPPAPGSWAPSRRTDASGTGRETWSLTAVSTEMGFPARRAAAGTPGAGAVPRRPGRADVCPNNVMNPNNVTMGSVCYFSATLHSVTLFRSELCFPHARASVRGGGGV